MSKARCYRLYRIKPQDILAILQWDRYAAVSLPKLGLPDDARLAAVYYEPCEDVFLLRVEHPSFRDVPDGEAIPSNERLGVEWVTWRKQGDGTCRLADDPFPFATKRTQSSYWHERCLEAEAMASFQVGLEWREKCKAAEEKLAQTKANFAAWPPSVKEQVLADQNASLRRMLGEVEKQNADLCERNRIGGQMQERCQELAAELAEVKAERDKWKAQTAYETKAGDNIWIRAKAAEQRLAEVESEREEARAAAERGSGGLKTRLEAAEKERNEWKACLDRQLDKLDTIRALASE